MPTKRIPTKTMSAIEHLIRAAHSDELTSVQLGFTEGASFFIGHMSLQDKDGNWSYFWCDDGDWYEHIEVE